MHVNTKLLSPTTTRLTILSVVILVITTVVVSVNLSNPFYVVTSGSMTPTLIQNDIVVVLPTPFESLKVGDIIVFNKSVDGIGNALFIHRIIEITYVDEQRIIKTRGDYNTSSLEGLDFPITDNDYVGKMIFRIPYAGYFTKVVNPPINYIVIAVILGSVFLLRYNKRI